MKTASVEFARELIDFAPTDETQRMGFGESQLHGAVAAYNMLARNRIAYLADEVGMGKTYVALGVFGLMRHLQPEARVMVIAPRENIQRKWVKELRNFVRKNWRVDDNRVRSLQGDPVRDPVRRPIREVCHRKEPRVAPPSECPRSPPAGDRRPRSRQATVCGATTRPGTDRPSPCRRPGP